jgi:hypothetical protein
MPSISTPSPRARIRHFSPSPPLHPGRASRGRASVQHQTHSINTVAFPVSHLQCLHPHHWRAMRMDSFAIRHASPGLGLLSGGRRAAAPVPCPITLLAQEHRRPFPRTQIARAHAAPRPWTAHPHGHCLLSPSPRCNMRSRQTLQRLTRPASGSDAEAGVAFLPRASAAALNVSGPSRVGCRRAPPASGSPTILDPASEGYAEAITFQLYRPQSIPRGLHRRAQPSRPGTARTPDNGGRIHYV